MRKMQQAGAGLCVLEETALVAREERYALTLKIPIYCHTTQLIYIIASQGRRVGKRKSASAEEGGYDLGQIDTGSDGTSSSRRQDPRSTAEQQQGFLFDDDASGSASVNDIDGTEGLHNSVLHTMVSSENDALNILFEAAARSDPVDAYTSASRTSINGFTNTQESPQSVESAPQLVNINSANFDVLHIWNACRFVKMGWFTAREAMTLVDL